MRAPTPSEPKSTTFPTYQVPQESAMWGGASSRSSAPPVQQVARAARGGRADPPGSPTRRRWSPEGAIGDGSSSVINGSRCPQHPGGNSNVKMQSVTENYCLLNYSTTTTVTVPKKQRKDHRGRRTADAVDHNNSDKLDSKFGALSLGRDIPNQKSDDLEVLDYDLNNVLIKKNLNTANCDTTDSSSIDIMCENMTKPIQITAIIVNNDHDDDIEGLRCDTPLRLRGGGESSLSTGTSSWGTPPSQQSTNNNASGWGSANPANQASAGTQQWNATANANRPTNQGPKPSQNANKVNSNGQQPATSQSSTASWGQPGTKPSGGSANGPQTTVPATSGSGSGPNVQNNNGPATSNTTPSTTNTTKQQLEQLNNMREAIFSQDGWGGQHVNQDTSWDIPGSPEPQGKMDGSGPAPWKPTVNNGTELWEANLRNGGQPPPQPQQKTPWGHTPSTNIGGTWGEDDDTDSSNVWTGVPSAAAAAAVQQQWGGGANNGAMWGGPKKENEWSGGGGPGGAGGGGGGWGDPRGGDPRQPSGGAGGGAGGMDPRDMRPDMRSAGADQMRLMDPRDPMRQLAAGGDMRGDPRGITGRINAGGAEAFWASSGHPTVAHNIHPQSKMPMGPGNGAGWEEPSPPTQRRNMPNYDDGTSLWGNPQQGSHWKDLPTGAGMGRGGNGGGGVGGPPGMAQSRLKPDGAVWGHGGGGARNNGAWEDLPSGGGGGGVGWDDNGPWQKPKLGGGPLWGENDIDWAHKQAGVPPKQLTKEMIWNSKPFRMLVENGYKKDDVENALKLRDMNVEEALELLNSMRTPDTWRGRHDDHYDHPQFPGQRFPSGPGGGQMFPPGGNGGGGPNLLNNMNSSAPNNLINNMSPAVVQKLLTQGGGGGGASQGFVGGGAGRALQPQSQPSTQQLRMLVQQIQMAVQAGYLNHQILNQPLAPQTLVLLNQLLQQIKTLQELLGQQALAKPNTQGFLQCSVLITKTKQQIQNLQNQIAAQQAIYVKTQHQGIRCPDLFKTNSMHEPIGTLQTNFADLGIAKDPQQQQQSRLNQWINKDKEDGDFSRAPGTSSKPIATSPNINPLGLTQPDGPWSSGRSGGETGWPDSGVSDNSNDVKDAQWSTPAQQSLTDLVPEFEPGKPWKGNQLKSIEDDPSITPGSVVRSPLSIATIKDSEIFMNPSKSPPAGDNIQPLISSSTWSYNPPPSSTSSAFTSPQNKLPTSKGGLGDLNPSTAVTSELWGAPKRGPPPGLSAKTSSLANGWSSAMGSATAAPWSSAAGQRASGNWNLSPWLLLRNLTAQIDGSTLRTLCMQHGPLQSFHLYLHQGFALAKYSSREEASKAQTALNNCVLGNTTILAENPSDWDATALLQQLASQQSSSAAWRGSTTKQTTGNDTWGTGWPNNTSTSLWGNSALDSSDQSRATPSSLNSFLPNDLLGGESM